MSALTGWVAGSALLIFSLPCLGTGTAWLNLAACLARGVQLHDPGWPMFASERRAVGITFFIRGCSPRGTTRRRTRCRGHRSDATASCCTSTTRHRDVLPRLRPGAGRTRCCGVPSSTVTTVGVVPIRDAGDGVAQVELDYARRGSGDFLRASSSTGAAGLPRPRSGARPRHLGWSRRTTPASGSPGDYAAVRPTPPTSQRRCG